MRVLKCSIVEGLNIIRNILHCERAVFVDVFFDDLSCRKKIPLRRCPNSCLCDSCWVQGGWTCKSASTHRFRTVSPGRNESRFLVDGDGEWPSAQRQERAHVECCLSWPNLCYLARKQIDDHSQIKPALPGADVSDIHHPRLIGLRNGKLTLE